MKHVASTWLMVLVVILMPERSWHILGLITEKSFKSEGWSRRDQSCTIPQMYLLKVSAMSLSVDKVFPSSIKLVIPYI